MRRGRRVRGREYTPVHVMLLVKGKHTGSAVVLTGVRVLTSLVAASLRSIGSPVRIVVVPS